MSPRRSNQQLAPDLRSTGSGRIVISDGALDLIGVELDGDGEDAPPYELLVARDGDAPAGLGAAQLGTATLLRERITSPRRIRELVAIIARQGWRGRIVGGELVRMRPVAVWEPHDTVVWDLDGTPPNGPFEVAIAGYNSVFCMRVAGCRPAGHGRIESALPTEIVRVRHRGPRRVAAPAGTRVTLVDPKTGEALGGTLSDVSLRGFSIELDAPRPHWPLGLAVPRIDIHLSGEAPVRLAGEVRGLQAGGALVRLSVDARLARASATWLAMVTRQLHPTTAIGSRWADATWRLYQRAGYFRLSNKSDADFAALREDFMRVSRRFDEAPELGVQTVFPSEDGEVVAALSAVRLYSGSWFGYQMAKVSGEAPDGTSGRDVLRDLHVRTYEHVQRDPAARWIIGFPQVKRVWSRLVHYDLPRRYERTGMAAIVRFRALELDSHAPSSAHHPELEIAEAGATDRAIFFRRVAAERPAAYVEALDLVPARFDLTKHHAALRAAGLGAERTLIAARRHGRLVAVALLESNADGLHLFRLLDAVRLYRITDDGHREFPALLDAARAWYRARGKQRFVCMLEDDGALPAEARAGMVDMGEADMTILAAELLPELLEHLCEVTAPRFGRQGA